MVFFSRFNTVLLVAVATSFFVANVEGQNCCPRTDGSVGPCVGDPCSGFASCVGMGFQLICDANKIGNSGVYMIRSVDNSIMKGNNETMDDDLVMDMDESGCAVGIIGNNAAASSLLLAVGGVAVAAIAGL
jgi:hypothetical protein